MTTVDGSMEDYDVSYDFTQKLEGTVIPFYGSVVLCPHCGRSGMPFDEAEDGFIIHVVGPKRWISDLCRGDGRWTIAKPAPWLPERMPHPQYEATPEMQMAVQLLVMGQGNCMFGPPVEGSDDDPE